MNATQEDWCPVVGYEDLYEVSSIGRVRSLPHIQLGRDGVQRRWHGRMMQVAPACNGYPRVNLTRDAAQKPYYVHTLMLEAFVGPRPFPKANARHLNDIRTDNRIENLAWGSPSDNNYDLVRNGSHVQASKTQCPQGHEYNTENTYISPRGWRYCNPCRINRQRKKGSP